MLRATKIVPAGMWHGTPADVVRLDYDRRTRRRIALTGTARSRVPARSRQGARAALPATASGSKTAASCAVEAAPERLLEITCADEQALARIAWHLGNRHLATEIGDRVIHIRDDHVIADMARASVQLSARSSAPSIPKAAPTATAPSTATASTGTITTIMVPSCVRSGRA